MPAMAANTMADIQFASTGARMSTQDFQDRYSSRQWQHDNATALIAAHDVGPPSTLSRQPA